MWHTIVQYMTDWLRVLCTILAFVIPFAIYKINARLHKYGDPPWKNSSEKEGE